MTYLVHHGVKGMKWGVRKQATPAQHYKRGRQALKTRKIGSALVGLGTLASMAPVPGARAVGLGLALVGGGLSGIGKAAAKYHAGELDDTSASTRNGYKKTLSLQSSNKYSGKSISKLPEQSLHLDLVDTPSGNPTSSNTKKNVSRLPENVKRAKLVLR